MPWDRGLMEEVSAEMGEGATKSLRLDVRENMGALRGSRLLPVRNPQARKGVKSSAWEIVPPGAH